MSIMDFLNVGSTLANGVLEKKRVADSSDLTKMIRIAATFRPYVTGGADGRFLPKGGYWKDQQLAGQWRLGFRYGPIFDAQFRRPQN